MKSVFRLPTFNNCRHPKKTQSVKFTNDASISMDLPELTLKAKIKASITIMKWVLSGRPTLIHCRASGIIKPPGSQCHITRANIIFSMKM